MSIKDELQRAYLDLQAKVGTFLQTGSETIRLRDRSKAYASSSSSHVRQASQAITAKAGALLANMNSIQNQAVSLIKEGYALQSEIETSPKWRGLLEGDLSKLSQYTLREVQGKFATITALTKNMMDLNRDIDLHIQNVKGLSRDVRGLEEYAQGKGILPRIEALSTSVKDVPMRLATIGGIALAVYLLGPSLLARVRR